MGWSAMKCELFLEPANGVLKYMDNNYNYLYKTYTRSSLVKILVWMWRELLRLNL